MSVAMSLEAIQVAASVHPVMRPAAYAAVTQALPREDLEALVMVMAEGSLFGPDAARELAARL